MLILLNTVLAASLLFLFQSAAGPPAGSDERRVVLTNNTRQPITEIYVSDDDGVDNWQKDLLGSESLLPGRSVIVDVDDRNGNCKVNIKTVLDDGSGPDQPQRQCLPPRNFDSITSKRRAKKRSAFGRFAFFRLGNFHWLGSVPSNTLSGTQPALPGRGKAPTGDGRRRTALRFPPDAGW